MSIHGYVGNIITANPTAPTVSLASGVWTTEQQLQAIAAGNWPGYEYPISRSLRFNSADSAYLNRTPASAGNRDTWTYSAWIKRSILSTNQTFFSARSDGSNYDYCSFNTSDQFSWAIVSGGSTVGRLITTQVFRDVSSWYHFLITYDSGNATGGNRMRFYVNGTEVTAFGTDTNPSQNQDGNINNTIAHNIGRFGDGTEYCNYYQTETYFIDGQALTPSSFGETDSNTGVWKPKAYTGTYGTNGFYLSFKDNTSTTTLGYDDAGSNDWTTNNFSVTAGAGNDSLVDSPTSYGTDTGVGGEVRGNYCTLNPLDNGGTAPLNGNLELTAGAAERGVRSTFAIPTTGLYYAEALVGTNQTNLTDIAFGFVARTTNLSATPIVASNVWAIYGANTTVITRNGSSTLAGAGGALVVGDILQVAIDLANNKGWIGKNNTWFNGTTGTDGNPSTGANPTFTFSNPPELFVLAHCYLSTINVNFGQRAFAYTAPSGFKALCTTNLPTPTIGATSTTQAGKYFGVALYSGTGSGNSNVVSGLEFTTDLWWQKARNLSSNNYLQDAVRGFGASKSLTSNSTGTEGFNGTPLTQSLSVSSTGFTVSGSDFNGNTSSETYVTWCWNAGGSNATNTSGTITSTVRANTTSGFSIVTYTGNGSSSATVGHGLGVVPAMVITKPRSASGDWFVAHTSLGNGNLILNQTLQSYNPATQFSGGGLATLNSSTTFGFVAGSSSANNVNANGTTYVAYCFAAVAGYSAFGSYTGNGSTDGPFVFTGFRPRWIMMKRTDQQGSWWIEDTSRAPYNPENAILFPNLSNAEFTTAGVEMDGLSNGFKIRNSNADNNASGGTYIYMAFAEFPFKFSLAR